MSTCSNSNSPRQATSWKTQVYDLQDVSNSLTSADLSVTYRLFPSAHAGWVANTEPREVCCWCKDFGLRPHILVQHQTALRFFIGNSTLA